jgi:hypothetical protein
MSSRTLLHYCVLKAPDAWLWTYGRESGDVTSKHTINSIHLYLKCFYISSPTYLVLTQNIHSPFHSSECWNVY